MRGSSAVVEIIEKMIKVKAVSVLTSILEVCSTSNLTYNCNQSQPFSLSAFRIGLDLLGDYFER